MATASSKVAKKKLRILVSKAEANTPPNQAPIIIPGTNNKTTGHNTACFLWCARVDEIDVITMTANEVATAICIRCC